MNCFLNIYKQEIPDIPTDKNQNKNYILYYTLF